MCVCVCVCVCMCVLCVCVCACVRVCVCTHVTCAHARAVDITQYCLIYHNDTDTVLVGFPTSDNAIYSITNIVHSKSRLLPSALAPGT